MAEVIDVVMPQMGVSVSEGTISRWLKAEGESIEKDETMLEISTDKVDTEVPSPASGVVTKILTPEGETVDVGVTLAQITVGDAGAAGGDAGGEAPVAAAQEVPTEQPEQQAAPQLSMETPGPQSPGPDTMPAQPAATQQPAEVSANGATSQGAPSAGGEGGARFVSPVVAKIAGEHNVDVSQVPGTGNGGRVTKKDILSFIEGGGQAQQPAAATAVAPAATTVSTVTAPSGPAPGGVPFPAAAATAATAASQQPAAAPATFTGGERVVPFNAMRKAIARHMIQSVNTSAHVTSTIEVDMTRVVNMRNQIKSEIEQAWGVKVTFTHFVCRALIDAIAHWPLINSEIRGDSAVIKSYVNLGIAVALDGGEGLIVPVMKNAEEKNLVGLARSVNDLAGRARTKKLSPDDVQGGTFTLTNPGIFGAIHGTPIINQPQAAILDTEAIVKRPVVVTDTEGNDSIAVRHMMNLCLSYDHRLIDGAYAVQFLAHIKRNLQEWDLSRFTG